MHEGYFVLNRQDSLMRTWNQDGVLLEEGTYCYGSKCGTWSTFDEAGILRMKEEFRDSVTYLWELVEPGGNVAITGGEGIETTRFDDGDIREQTTYADGLPNGTHKVYYSDGELRIDGNYKDGLRHGTWKEFYRYGAIEKRLSMWTACWTACTSSISEGVKSCARHARRRQKQGDWAWFVKTAPQTWKAPLTKASSTDPRPTTFRAAP